MLNLMSIPFLRLPHLGFRIYKRKQSTQRSLESRRPEGLKILHRALSNHWGMLGFCRTLINQDHHWSLNNLPHWGLQMPLANWRLVRLLLLTILILLSWNCLRWQWVVNQVTYPRIQLIQTQREGNQLGKMGRMNQWSGQPMTSLWNLPIG